MSLSCSCDAIMAISDESSLSEIGKIASECEPHLENAKEIIDTVENALNVAGEKQRLNLWFLVDRLAKTHEIFLEELRPRVIALLTRLYPTVNSPEWSDFVTLLNSSFTILFGQPLVSLVLTKISSESKNGSGSSNTADASPQSAVPNRNALALRRNVLRGTGAFITKPVSVHRTAYQKHRLLVKTIDSQMAMATNSSYAPAKPVEIAVNDLRPEADAPRGYMKPLPANYMKDYEDERRKRLREVMEKNREEQDRRQDEQLLAKFHKGQAANETDKDGANEEEDGEENQIVKGIGARDDFADVIMPLEFPRDEFGVKRGNFPLGVRFIKNAIKECGGALELDVISNRIATLANREISANFGDVREFIQIHSPSFRLNLENDVWVVRLTDDLRGADEPTWVSMVCPSCSKKVKGRNFARHHNCRECISIQISLGLRPDAHQSVEFQKSPITNLAFLSRETILKIERGLHLEDFDLDCFADAIEAASRVRRFRLSSTKNMAPVLKALRLVRDRWLQGKGVTEMSDAIVTAGDAAVAHLFAVFGRNVHRLPVAWIELGDVIDMCSRFSDRVLPPFTPPPRPADPRISLYNEYPGFLFCESDVDDEDVPTTDEDEFSDDEGVMFTFAPPVSVAESLFTAGFERDTKKLQHRMRTAPPMVVERVLKTDHNQTQAEMYNTMNSVRNARFEARRKL